MAVLPSAAPPEGARAAEQEDGGGGGGAITSHVPRPAEPAAAVVQVEGWCWTTCGRGIELTEQGLVAGRG